MKHTEKMECKQSCLVMSSFKWKICVWKHSVGDIFGVSYNIINNIMKKSSSRFFSMWICTKIVGEERKKGGT